MDGTFSEFHGQSYQSGTGGHTEFLGRPKNSNPNEKRGYTEEKFGGNRYKFR